MDSLERLYELAINLFYQESKHLGMMLFGSTVKNRTPSSDIDLVIFSKESTNFSHYVDEKKGFTFDVFEMPIELGFFEIRRRNQMRLKSFSMAKTLKGAHPLEVLKYTSTNIIENIFDD
jgi:predicted nucleotidyltransferase